MTSMTVSPEGSHYRSRTGVLLPRTMLLEPKTLSSKKDRERLSCCYIPPSPRPSNHNPRSAPQPTRLLHSRLLKGAGFSKDKADLNNSFHALMSSSSSIPSKEKTSFFRTNFEIQERLGFGSFGDVFRVRSKLDCKEYAVKKTRRVYCGELDRAQQLKEVNRMAAIKSNPHLVQLELAWEEDGHLYLQMELCSKSLSEFIEDLTGCLSVEEVWDVLIDMLHALQHLHRNRLVHMDVKPENIFVSLSKPTKYKLGDFGIIVALNEKRDLNEDVEGDSRYLAPEVMQGVVSTTADVFSLGLTILEIACNVDLPKGGSLWHELRNGILPEPTNHLVPQSLDTLVRAMITPDVNKRPEVEKLMERKDVQDAMRRRRWFFRDNNGANAN